jgi:hypothetical protein
MSGGCILKAYREEVLYITRLLAAQESRKLFLARLVCKVFPGKPSCSLSYFPSDPAYHVPFPGSIHCA